MTAAQCFGCGRPMADSAYACVRCGITRPAEQLTQISDMVPAARDVAYGQTRRGGGGGSGKPGSRSPGNDDAMDVLAAVGNALTTIARDIAETRGLEILPDGSSRPLSVAVAAQNGLEHPTSTPDLLEAS